MQSRISANGFSACVLFALAAAPSGFAQERLTRIEPGTNISIRTNDPIDVQRSDNRVYYGVVDQEVRGSNGRLGIPRGSRVELIVRVMRDNDLILDLESVELNGQRYAIQADKTRVQSRQDNSLIGSLAGAISGGNAYGRAVRIPRDSTLSFRVQTPLVVGVADRGVDRGGYHYHDWYKRDDYYRR